MQKDFKSRQSRRQFLAVAGGATLSGLVLWLGYRLPQPAAAAALSNDDYIIVNGWVLAAGDLEVESGAL